MTAFHVSYYKILQNTVGHTFKCLQRAIDVDAPNPSAALTLIENNGLSLADCDCLEVTTLANAEVTTEAEALSTAERAARTPEERTSLD